MKRITFFEHHDFYKRKDYFFFLFFLLLVTERLDSLLLTILLNTVYTAIYFGTIWLIDHKTILIDERMISKRGKRFPLKLVEQLVHNGRYLYVKFNKNQYMKIYDPNKKLTNQILLHQDMLSINKQSLSFIERRV